jgi:hypothetical protein
MAVSSARKDARWMVATKMIQAIEPEVDTINELDVSGELLGVADHILDRHTEAEIQAFADEWNER